ncbi:2-methylene-furan-3-one reductase [Sesamum alatum]|uniref:2-methylene-furan-3-one reductase n=1 Tax=Sesamum alatum TaxID=300844 RepID=A0AAE1XW76_9LAMI|nr:2-methylene-furan-3-one reductase [Sesamum alatum]
MQKAWFYEEYGPKDVQQLGDVLIPYPQTDQLLVQVVPGCDMVGVVVAKGDGVLRFDVDNEAEGKLRQLGFLAEFVVLEEELVVVKPKNVSFEEAASLPVAVQTTVEGFKIAGFKKEHTGKVDFVKGLGTDKVVDYTKTSSEGVEEKYDLVFDTIVDSRKSYMVAKEDAPVIDITWLPSNPRAWQTNLTASGKILEELGPHLESGRLKAVIDRTGPFPFSNGIEAFGKKLSSLPLFPPPMILLMHLMN